MASVRYSNKVNYVLSGLEMSESMRSKKKPLLDLVNPLLFWL